MNHVNTTEANRRCTHLAEDRAAAVARWLLLLRLRQRRVQLVAPAAANGSLPPFRAVFFTWQQTTTDFHRYVPLMHHKSSLCPTPRRAAGRIGSNTPHREWTRAANESLPPSLPCDSWFGMKTFLWHTVGSASATRSSGSCMGGGGRPFTANPTFWIRIQKCFSIFRYILFHILKLILIII